MRLLCIDTCLDACSVGIFDAGTHRYKEQRPLARGHAEVLGSMTHQALVASGLTIGALDRIAVTTGPGSFTGVRVGVAFARGLVIGHKIPLVGYSTLEVLAHQALKEIEDDTLQAGVLCAAFIDARRGEVYGQIFSSDRTPLCAPFAHSPLEAARQLGQVLNARAPGRCFAMFCGNGAGLVREACARAQDEGEGPLRHFAPSLVKGGGGEGKAGPDLLSLAQLAMCEHGGPAAPLYIRAADAKKTSFL